MLPPLALLVHVMQLCATLCLTVLPIQCDKYGWIIEAILSLKGVYWCSLHKQHTDLGSTSARYVRACLCCIPLRRSVGNMTNGTRPKVRAMLKFGLPRCLIQILALLAYMDNVAAWLSNWFSGWKFSFIRGASWWYVCTLLLDVVWLVLAEGLASILLPPLVLQV